MLTPWRDRATRPELESIIAQARRRWRLRVVLRGLAVVLAVALVTLLVSAFGLERFRFSPSSIVAFRIVSYLAIAASAVVFLILPLLRRLPDERIALYLEEHHPALGASLVSAVEMRHGTERTTPQSAALVRRLVETAVERCLALDAGRQAERDRLRQSSWVLGGLVLAALALLFFGPSALRHAVRALVPTGAVEAASPYRIDVRPGSTTIPRGSDQIVSASLVGFESDRVDVFTRSDPNASFDRLALVLPEGGAAYEGMLFDVGEPVEYFVEAAGVRSPVFRLDVADLPYVQQLQLEYHFPAYTGLEPRLVEEGGDIAVLRGTEIRVRVVPTIPSPSGRLVIGESASAPLAATPDGALEGAFTVEEDGFYRIELAGGDGTLVSASPQYTIDALDDQPPSVTMTRPGRDSRASSLEEVFVEARADDDFGIGRLDLLYSVNGGEEKRLPLFSAREAPRREVSAGHTFFLEELTVEPGDVVSYYARATDSRTADAKTATSDIFFIQITPFGQEFRAAETQAMGGGGGAGMTPGGLSEQQRQIVTATFNVLRDRERQTAEEYREQLVFLTLAQGQLREQVETLVQQLTSRIVEADESFREIAELLPKAAEEMRAAEDRLRAQNAKDALAPEQRALQLLLRAEAAYEDVRVAMGNPAGGGGGGSSPMAEDLADLFQLELDKLQNQYETLQRGQQQAADNQVDELLERLRELARRQEQEAERQRRRASGDRNTLGGAAGQRQLAEQAEEAARRLERLSRERQRPDLAEAARQLQEAADAMRRAAASGDSSGLSQASSALERLQDVRDRLEREQSNRLTRDIDDALRRVEALQREQEDISGQVGNLGEAGARSEAGRRLLERKDAQANEVADLERQIDRAAADFTREQPDAAGKLREAADGIRDDKLKEKIRYSRGLLQAGSPEQAESFEAQIGADLEALERRLQEAAGAVGEREADRLTRALDETRELVRGMESLGDRMRQGDQPGQEGQRGQEGQQGQQAQEGSPGGSQQGSQASGQQPAQPGDSGATGRPGGTEGDTVATGPLTGSRAGGGSSRPAPFSTDAVRQFRREIRERSADAQRLRGELAAEGLEVGDLDDVIRAMRELDSGRVYADAAELARLQTFVVEGLKRFEYALRRELRGDEAQQLFLSGSMDAPVGFRELVEEYYRSLSRDQR